MSMRKIINKPLRAKHLANSDPAVKLESIRYSEFTGTDKEWNLEEVRTENTSLIVGKNASGKSRFLSVISSLAKLLTGEVSKLFVNADYTASFISSGVIFTYTVVIIESQVVKETLVHDGKTVLDRGGKGIGKIWAQKLKKYIDFEAPKDQLAAKNRRDSIQHPFFEDLHTWASLLKYFQFGTLLGKDRLIMAAELSSVYEEMTDEVRNADEVLTLYIKAYTKFGADFDRCILSDLAFLGYDCTDVGAESAESNLVKGAPLVWLYVKERDVIPKISQINMSQGMFRALSLVIHFNYCIFCEVPRTILIDDIGEGLDFSRSQALIKLLYRHATKNNIQLMMTTNDRFVMNSVPLVNWGVVTRSGSNVRLLNYSNSRQIFDEFEHLGLNNFDFFSTNFFEEGFNNQ